LLREKSLKSAVSNSLFCMCSLRERVGTEIRALRVKNSVIEPISNSQIDGPTVAREISIELGYAITEGHHY